MPALTEEELNQLSHLVNQPYKVGKILDSLDIPIKLKHIVQEHSPAKIQTGHGGTYSDRPDLVPISEVENVLNNTPPCTPDSRKHPDAPSVSDELEKNGLSLVAHAALLFAGRESLEAVKRFKKEFDSYART